MIDSYKDLKIGFIGAGKVGFSLGKLFSNNNIHVTGYYSKHIESAKEAANFTNSETYNDLKTIVNSSNALFLTVNDSEISNVFQSIKDLNITGKLICHTSGALSSTEVFADVDKYGAFGYSVHPLFPVSNKYNSYKELTDAFFCIEGNDNYIEIINDLLKSINIKTKIINSTNKIKYHAACAISSNLVCGLINQSVSMLLECGFEENEALKALNPLIESNINHILNDGLISALTGPLERADYNTIEKHINCFETANERQLYKAVSLQVLNIAKEKHIGRDYITIENLLKEK